MTNSIGYQNQQLPVQYSGVTINVTSPVMNTAPVHKVYPNCPPEHHHVVNGVCTHPACQQNFPYSPVGNNIGVNNSGVNNGVNPADVNQNYPSAYGYQEYNTQGFTNSAYENTNPNQISENVNNSNNIREVYSEKEVYAQAQSNGMNATSQVVQGQPQAYPAQYYLNNYNYPQYIQPNSNNVAPTDMTNGVVQTAEVEKEEDLTKSQDIITNLDERVNEQKDLEKNGKSKRVVVLTNEYIMSLENYLNNPNSEIRIMAAKEILTRFDEDKDRYDDAALNALLNKMLQDPEKIVRIAALSALSSQLASGNEYTVELLNNIQKDPNSNKEDVLQAANILLQMSADTEVKYTAVPPVEIQPEQEQQQEQQQ